LAVLESIFFSARPLVSKPSALNPESQVGDELSTVDGQPVASLESMFELSKLLLGLEGSKTALEFKKKGLHPLRQPKFAMSRP
jgi:hypothetical protein